MNQALERKYEEEKEVLHVIETITGAPRRGRGSRRPDRPAPLGPQGRPLLRLPPDAPRRGIDSPERPSILENLIRTLGAEPTEFRLKMKCCCGPIFMPEEEAAAETLIRILQETPGPPAPTSSSPYARYAT